MSTYPSADCARVALDAGAGCGGKTDDRGDRCARPLTVLGLLGAALALAAGAPCWTARPAQAVVPNKGELYVGLDFGQIGHYTNTGTLLETLNSTHATSKSTGMCFDASGNLRRRRA